MIKKGNSSMADYIACVTLLVNSLNIARSLLIEEEISFYLLSGLGLEYKAIVTNITT
jgi:hypothetical protein